MSIVLNGTTGIETPALDSDGSLTLGTAVMAVPTGDAPLFGCRAWVNFDGTKDTTGAASTANTNRLIRASGNVTSVLRNGTGNYTVNFTTAMPDADYSTVTGTALSSTIMGVASPTEYFVDSVRIRTSATNAGSMTTATFSDHPIVCVTIIR